MSAPVAGVRARAAGRLSRQRDFRLLWTGDTVSAVGDAVTLVALPLVALESLHASVSATAGLTGVPFVPVLVLGLPVGAWVDRLPRRPVLLTSSLVAAVSIGSVPLAATVGVLTFAQLVVVSLLLGMCRLVTQTAAAAYLPEVVARDQLTEANGALQASVFAAQIGGPSIGGLLVQLVSSPFALAADAVSYLASAWSLALIRTRPTRRAPAPRQRGALVREVRDGLRDVVDDPVLRVLMINAAVANLSLSAADALTVPFLRRTLGLAPGSLGLLIGLGGAGGVVGAAVAGRLARRFGTARVVLVGVLATTPAGLLVPLAERGPRLALFVGGLFVLFLGLGIYNVTVSSYRQAATPPLLIGRVTAAMRVVMQGVIPLGAGLGAGLAAVVGLRSALAISLAIDLLPGVVLFLSPVRGVRDLPVDGRPQPVRGQEER